MRRLRLILGIGLLATMLTVGTVACDDDEDNGNGEETAVPTEPADDADGDDADGDDADGDDTEDEPEE